MVATTLLLLSILLGTALTYKMSLWENTLKDIITKNKRVVESKYITFTTTSDDGWPAARTVVFRGFHEQDNKVYLKFISDSRSQKISDIAKNNKVELCWYLTKNKDQFRIRGHAVSVGITSTDAKAAKLRVQLWNGLSDGARSPFFFPGNPGDLVETPTIDSSVIKVAAEEVVTNDPKSSIVQTESVEETGMEPAQANIRKKFVPTIPDPETVRALRAERKTGEEEPSKDVCPPPDCFNLILVDPITGGNTRYIHHQFYAWSGFLPVQLDYLERVCT
jgi:pyridoxamine 5'-phosphate oxidase